MVNESIVCCLCSTFCRCIPLMGLFIDSKCISFIDFFNLRKLRKTFFKTDQVLMGKKKIRFSKIDAALFRCSSMDRVQLFKKQFIQKKKYDVCNMPFSLYLYL